MLLVIFSTSCVEENYKDINIANLKPEENIKEFVGDLTSHIVVMNMKGETITEIDMGEAFYVIENTEGGASSRKWTIAQGTATISPVDQLIRLNYGTPGIVNITLSSTRSSDGKTVTSTATVKIKSIPVSAKFITNPVEVDNKINILTSKTITFSSISLGSPTMYSWKFEGPETLTSTEKNPTITFMKPGTYKVTFSVKRDDGPDGISENALVKESYIKVDQLVVDLIRAVATDNKILLQFTKPIAQNIPANAINEFSIVINNAAKGLKITPQVLGISAKSESTVELTFSDKMYSNDEVLISFTPTGILKDGTGFYTPEKITNEPCVYGYNLWTNSDTEDEAKFSVSTGQKGTGYFKFVNENSPMNPMKPYQGKSCMVLAHGSDGIGVSLLQGFTVAAGDVVELAYEGRMVDNASGSIERRMSKTMASGANDANGNWTIAKDNAGLNVWKTITKQIAVSSGTNGQTGVLYFTMLRYGGAATSLIWFDNIRIYKPNPRP